MICILSSPRKRGSINSARLDSRWSLPPLDSRLRGNDKPGAGMTQGYMTRSKIFYSRGQSSVEYIALLIVVIGALLAFGSYFKRGLQGHWKLLVDDLGEQYDPRLADTKIEYHLLANTETRITTFNVTNGIWTLRQDWSNSMETRTG